MKLIARLFFILKILKLQMIGPYRLHLTPLTTEIIGIIQELLVIFIQEQNLYKYGNTIVAVGIVTILKTQQPINIILLPPKHLIFLRFLVEVF